MRTIEIEWCTNYNGVSLNLQQGEPDETLEHALESASESLPEVTYDIVGAELCEQINEGEEDGEAIEDKVSEADIQRVIDAARTELAKFTEEQFNFVLTFNHSDT